MELLDKFLFPQESTFPTPPLSTCPEMPRSALQGQVAISEQPEPVLDSHHAMQSSLFPSSDVFQPAPGSSLTLTCVQLLSHSLEGSSASCRMQPWHEPSPVSLHHLPASITVGSPQKQQFNSSFYKENPFMFYCAEQTLPSTLTSMGIPPQVPCQSGLAAVLCWNSLYFNFCWF